ncbi:SLA class II histocompatibility antigen, DQ haplotype D beta chain-like [Esox lucius]|uniref:Ig-like domain-containing protein n=1 Tax=Esox lucius TaxID=8010 RepID=A0A3P8ZYN7_ESOLU|nr:SLA class II histocompatibility antigen, DQ haplotype D beta chain-like [Esox lucius]XP_034143025.1 SLA class II histocompatibility antigen, DQ haplotype D beta chain-like [Esox lucius]
MCLFHYHSQQGNMAIQNIYIYLLGFLSISYRTDGYYEQVVDECRFTSKDLQDAEFIRSYVFNMVEDVRFNSSVGEYVGYTELGVKNAKAWNSDPGELAGIRAQLDSYCRNNAGIHYSAVLDKTAKPYVRMSSVTPPSGRHTAMLMCSAYDFYPKQIRVTWQRDGHEIKSDVTSTEELADGDWYYQIHSHLEYTPKSGEKISCMVEHSSLPEPMVYDWDPSMPESERNKIAIGASGLVLGAIIALAGLVYYKKKSAGVL